MEQRIELAFIVFGKYISKDVDCREQL
jgi:hypothetical protein